MLSRISGFWRRWLEDKRSSPAVPTVDLQQDRLVVFDLETTGLDTQSDRMLSIGALAIHGDVIELADSFDCLVTTDLRLEHDNVLVHRLTPDRLRQGLPPAAALSAFTEFVDSAPLFAYHAGFDRAILQREAAETGVALPAFVIIDVMDVLTLCHPEYRGSKPGLDEVVQTFGIAMGERHEASVDALVTAQLLLRLLTRLRQDGTRSLQVLLERLSYSRKIAQLHARH